MFSFGKRQKSISNKALLRVESFSKKKNKQLLDNTIAHNIIKFSDCWKFLKGETFYYLFLVKSCVR